MHHFLTVTQKEIKRHLFDYLLLTTGGIFFLISLNLFKGERLVEFIIIIAFTSFYILWGIYHHIIENSLHLKIVVEYVLIGFILMFLLRMVVLPG